MYGRTKLRMLGISEKNFRFPKTENWVNSNNFPQLFQKFLNRDAKVETILKNMEFVFQTVMSIVYSATIVVLGLTEFPRRDIWRHANVAADIKLQSPLPSPNLQFDQRIRWPKGKHFCQTAAYCQFCFIVRIVVKLFYFNTISAIRIEKFGGVV